MNSFNKDNEFKALTLLLVPNNGLENMTSLQILADELRQRGHKTIFAVNIAANGLITSFNDFIDFDQILTQSSPKSSFNSDFDFEFEVFQLSAIEVFEKFSLKCLWKKLAQNKERDIYYQKLIERIRPDIIIIESMLTSPALTNSGIPWIGLNFGAPNQFINDKRLPPAWSGMSIISKSFNQKKREFTQKKNYLITEFSKQLINWCTSRGVANLSSSSLNATSPYFNVYVYPRELDFDLGASFPPKNWFRMSCLMKEDDNSCPLKIPNEIMSKPGNLIYLEMSSYGSADINLMKRLTTLLSHSANKFIVSKGPFHYEYELPDNMWGLESLPHKEAVKTSDLVITCGDTNIITEALFYGKPLIVMPLFGHQLDNAQRIKDNGFGIILEPYKCQISTTFGSINAMLGDPLVRRRLDNISYKMQNSDEIKTLCGLIEAIYN